MDAQKLTQLLGKIKFFDLLPEKARLEIIYYTELLTIKKSEILFEQGTPSHFVYILLEGELVSYLYTHAKEKKILSYIEPVQIIGELGVISNEPRSLSIQATKNAKLLKLSKDNFLKICKAYPAFLFDIVENMIGHTKENLEIIRGKRAVSHLIFLSPHKSNHLFEAFKKSIHKFLNSKKVGIFNQQDFKSPQWAEHLEAIEKKHEKIIIFSNFPNHALLKKSLTDDCQFYLVVDSNSKDRRTENSVNNIINYLKRFDEEKVYLVLLHSDDISFPRETIYWLKMFNFKLHHHIRVNNQPDFQRFFRFAFGTPVGLVLGGGGTRGLVHNGVIRALYEKKIPIDAICGTSSGSCIAGIYAISKNYPDHLRRALNAIHKSYKSISITDLTWPTISIYSGRKVNNTLHELFGDQKIEDLWIPYFCVSANLAEYQETIHQTGFLWQKIRASLSLPAIFPPALIDEEIHFDGALVNNLPVNVMQNLLGIDGIVIASQLGQYKKNSKGLYQFPDVLDIKNLLLQKNVLTDEKYKFPKFIDTLLSTFMIGAYQKERENSLLSHILIAPDLSLYGLIDAYSEKQEAVLMEKGYQEATHILNSYHHLLKKINNNKQ